MSPFKKQNYEAIWESLQLIIIPVRAYFLANNRFEIMINLLALILRKPMMDNVT